MGFTTFWKHGKWLLRLEVKFLNAGLGFMQERDLSKDLTQSISVLLKRYVWKTLSKFFSHFPFICSYSTSFQCVFHSILPPLRVLWTLLFRLQDMIVKFTRWTTYNEEKPKYSIQKISLSSFQDSQRGKEVPKIGMIWQRPFVSWILKLNASTTWLEDRSSMRLKNVISKNTVTLFWMI